MECADSLQKSKRTLKATVDAKGLYPKCYPEPHIERFLADLGNGAASRNLSRHLCESAPSAKQNYLSNFIRNWLELYHCFQPFQRRYAYSIEP